MGGSNYRRRNQGKRRGGARVVVSRPSAVDWHRECKGSARRERGKRGAGILKLIRLVEE